MNRTFTIAALAAAGIAVIWLLRKATVTQAEADALMPQPEQQEPPFARQPAFKRLYDAYKAKKQ